MSYWKQNPQQPIRLSGNVTGGSILGKTLRLIGVVVLLVVGFMFSIAIFALLAIGAGLLWCYFLWKTRKLRRQVREQQQAMGYPPETPSRPHEGEIIEGEVIEVVSENGSTTKKET